MKKTLTALFLVLTLVLCTTAVSAEHYWNDSMKFSAAYGTITVDGKIDGGEWDDSNAITVTLNNDPLAATGNINYQGEWESDDRDDKDFSGIYKIKWDDTNIYFLEDRNDDHVNLSGTADEPYTTDGTLAFTQVDNADGSLNPDGISVHAFYTVGKEGNIGGDLKARVCNMGDGSRETVDIPGGKVASTIKDGGFIIEIAIPWAFYTSYVPNFKGGVAGDLMGLSYVIHDSDADDTGFIKQLCYAIDNDNLGDVSGGYDFGSWGVVELLAAVAAPVVDDAPAEAADAPVVVADAAPSNDAADVAVAPAPVAVPVTGDSGMFMIIFILTISLAGVVTFSKSNKRFEQ